MANLCRFKDVYFTVVEKETYTYSNEITDKPVEDDSVVSDHIQNKPITISLTGVIIGDGTYPQQQLDLLRRYCIQGVVDNYYGMQTLWNFAIVSFENEHTCEVANGVKFTMTLKQIIAARKEVVNILTSDISIPDIEALKDQLSAQRSANKAAIRAKIIPPKRTGKQTKAKKEKPSVLEKIKSRY